MCPHPRLPIPRSVGRVATRHHAPQPNAHHIPARQGKARQDNARQLTTSPSAPNPTYASNRRDHHAPPTQPLPITSLARSPTYIGRVEYTQPAAHMPRRPQNPRDRYPRSPALSFPGTFLLRTQPSLPPPTHLDLPPPTAHPRTYIHTYMGPPPHYARKP